MVTPLERFHASYVVASNGCWLWSHSLAGAGYGRITANGVRVYAHRFAYATFVGLIPPQMFVLHRCDQPKCVNPQHLFLGTQRDNVADMIAKGRRHTGAWTAERRAKIGAASRGRRHTPEMKQYISERGRGRVTSDATKAKLRDARLRALAKKSL